MTSVMDDAWEKVFPSTRELMDRFLRRAVLTGPILGLSHAGGYTRRRHRRKVVRLRGSRALVIGGGRGTVGIPLARPQGIRSKDIR